MAKDKKTKEDFIVELKEYASKDVTDSEQYIYNLVDAYNQRMGNRPEQDDPYPGAPNVSMPWTEALIRKKAAPAVLSVVNLKKPCRIALEEGTSDPDGRLKERSRKAEKLQNLYLRKDKELLKKIALSTNYCYEKGRSYFMVVKKFKREAEYKTITKEEIVSFYDARRTEAKRILDIQMSQAAAQGVQVDKETLESQLPPTGEDQYQALRLLSKKDLKKLLYSFPEYGFKENEDLESNKKELDRVVALFKSGSEEIEYTIESESVIPVISSLPSEQIIVPKGTPMNIQRAWRIIREYYLNEDELIDLAEKGIFDKKVVENYLQVDRSNVDNINSVRKQQFISAGIYSMSDDMIAVRDVFHYYKDPTTNRLEKYILSYFPDDTDTAYLRHVRNDTSLDKWPIKEFDHELREDTAHGSRGIPAMVKDIQTTIDEAQCQRMIRDTIQNTPMFTIKKTAGMDGQEVQFIPGQGIEVNNADDITFFNPIKGADIALERIEAQQKSYGDAMLGGIDFAFGRASNVSGTGGAKTLGEIQLAQSEGQKLASLDLLHFHNTLSEVYQMYFEALKDTFNGSVEIDGEIITKSDLEFPADVRSNGSIEDSDRVFKAQKALVRYQLSLQNPPDMVTPEDRYNAYVDYLEQDGVEDVDRYSTNPIEVMNDQSSQLQQKILQLNQQSELIMENLEDREKDLTKVEEKIRRAKAKA